MIMDVIVSFLIFFSCSVFTAAYNCSENCAVPERNNTDSCDSLTGACSFGCIQGFAGDNCSFICPEHCGNPDGFDTKTCNISTGACLHGCQYGYTGSSCSIQCPENCMGHPDSNNTMVCDESSTACLFGCKKGFYGSNCTQKCSDTISDCDSCNQENRTSDVICTECNCCGLYLKNNVCTPCSYWCATGPYKLQVCNTENGECTVGCRVGRYGLYCERTCSSICKNNICDVYSGFCTSGCSPNSYCGTTCQSPCSDGCLQKTCNQSCVCSQGCQTNKWGEQCENDCSANCQKPSDTNINVCDRMDGTCTHGCVNNTLWGGQCSSACSQNCFNGTCERWSGNCTGGCTNNNVYGIGCDRECSSNCINTSCRRQDGFCEEGCISGSYGAQCDHKCNVHCVSDSCERLEGKCSCETGRFGTSCEFQCQETCVNRACHPMSGICTYGCINGYSGKTCDNISPMSPVSRAEIGIAIGEGMLFLILVTVIIYLVRKSDRCKGLRNKVSCGSDTLEKVLQGNTDPNPYTNFNLTNDAEATAKPHDAFDLHTTANIEVSSSNPVHTQAADVIL